MKKARSKESPRKKRVSESIEGASSIGRHALLLEVDWLREQGWTDNEIRGLWSRLLNEYTRTLKRVRGRQRR